MVDPGVPGKGRINVSCPVEVKPAHRREISSQIIFALPELALHGKLPCSKYGNVRSGEDTSMLSLLGGIELGVTPGGKGFG